MIHKSIKKYNLVNNETEDPSLLEELYDKFQALTPQDRNDTLQALFAAHLAGRTTIDNITLDLLKALMRSFDISIKFQELEGGSNDEDAF